MDTVSTGFGSVDDALGGLITGDNVVWVCDSDRVYEALAAGFARTARSSGQSVLEVRFGGTEHDRPESSADDVVEAGPRSPLARPSVLADELDRRFRVDRPDCLVVDDLSRPLHRWGRDATIAFFSRVCPSMLAAGTTAYWSVGSDIGRSGLDEIRQVTQCLLDVRNGQLRVLKAEGRPSTRQIMSYELQVDGDEVVASIAPTGGRLARGLVTLRRELDLTQQQLAAIAGVTASAISQAESGARRLSIDTLLRISDNLAIPVDRLVNSAHPPSYRLARHDRSRRIDDRVVSLIGDTTVGARVFLVDLPGDEVHRPESVHAGIEVIAAVTGLIQIDLGDDRPVLRGGDALVADEAIVTSWRNLRREPARFFRILRD